MNDDISIFQHNKLPAWGSVEHVGDMVIKTRLQQRGFFTYLGKIIRQGATTFEGVRIADLSAAVSMTSFSSGKIKLKATQ